MEDFPNKNFWCFSQGTYINNLGLATSVIKIDTLSNSSRKGKWKMKRYFVEWTTALPNDSLSRKEEKSEINMLFYMRNGAGADPDFNKGGC